MKKKITEIIKNNHWDVIAVSLKETGDTIYQTFSNVDDLMVFVDQNLAKYEVSLLDHALVLNQETRKTTLTFNFVFNSPQKELSDEYLKKLGDDIMIELKPDDVREIKRIESSLREKFLKVLSINTDDIQAQYYPFDQVHSYLRSDEETKTIDQSAVLENAPSHEGDYVTMVRVVK
ncbi:hypothetical protein LD125_00071 [Mesoplasma sp. JKS002658]|uniref:Asp-tRNA(Asn)/Glu-tRNA(Gln) amidotransferase subunit GatC n=1 Tax=Mesoplasma whartonense TaxID=2878854 RepID=UPI002022B38C|nr:MULTISPECIES: hypothetical protein [unclassified Mesoplasma]MCL8211680.1 hypothetical protein [Mesoplasma sp. JKS002664]MCL8212057.1 hypothetical protein [Mesoplasma sp. JKS002662]MCL8212682.1 hypothetical protein [Mesoplasma sp. JKS002661]MCL8213838.1 hypothetical protein [Mesoplasma sp. JKS002658]MCL8215016.1 hypothetical protein [Mesoplasma sp. JKS002663]